MSLELQMSEMRRSVDVATTKIDGQLAILLQKSEYSEQRNKETTERMLAEFAARDLALDHLSKKIDAVEERHDKRFKDNESKIDSVRARVFFFAGGFAVIGAAIELAIALTVKH